jgi:hypothetical protein
MADASEHIIRIIVRALTQGAGAVDRVSGEVQRLTGAQDKNTEAVKKNQRSVKDAQQTYAEFTKSVKEGKKDYDEAQFGLKRLASEMDNLAKKEPVGSRLSEDLHRSAQAARAMSEELKRARENEKQAADQELREHARREQERQRLTEETVKQEVKVEEQGARNRRSLLEEIMDEVQRDHDQRKRNERDLADFQIKESARVESARAAARANRVEPELVQQRPGILQRIRSAFTGDDDGVRRFREKVDRLGRSSDEVDSRLGRLHRTIERIGRTSDRAAFSIARIDNNLRGLIVLGAILFAEQLITALVGLGGQLLAVAGAAVQAGLSLGAAFVSGVGQAIPAIGLLVAAISRITAVFKAVQLFNKQVTQSGYDQARVADAQAAAADRIASANEGLISSNQRVADATDALTDARERARQKIEDLNIAERQANRSQFDAETALRRAVASGDVGAIEDLQIRRDQARLQVSRTSTDARGARTQGIKGSDEVRQAISTLDDANTALRRAEREQVAAGRAATKAATAGAAADRSLEQALALLTPAERQLYETAKRIQANFRRLFRPVTDIIVKSFTGAVERVNHILGDSRVVGSLRLIATQIANSIERISKALTSSKGLDFFRTMSRESAKTIPLLTTLALKIFSITSNLAKAGISSLRRFINFLIDLADKGDKATSSRSGLAKLEKFFLRGEKMAESIIKLGIAVAQLFLAFTNAGGARSGQDTIDDFTRTVQKATRWIEDNRKKVVKFFEDSRRSLDALGSIALGIGKALLTVFNPVSLEAFAKAFDDIVLPALVAVIKAVGVMTIAFLKFIDLPVIGDFAKWGIATLLLFKVFTTLAGVVGNLGRLMVLLLARLPLVGRAFALLGAVIRTSALVLTGPWGFAIAAVIASVALLNEKFHFLKDFVHTIGDAFKKVFGQDAPTAIKIAAAAVLSLAVLFSGRLIAAVRAAGAAILATAGVGAGAGAAGAAGGLLKSGVGKAGAFGLGAFLGVEALKGIAEPVTSKFNLPKTRNTRGDISHGFLELSGLGPLFGVGDNAPSSRAREFGNTAEQKLKSLIKSDNAQGLLALARQARDVARDAGGATDKFIAFAKAAEDAARRSTNAFRQQAESSKMRNIAESLISGRLSWSDFLNRKGFSEESERMVRDLIRLKSQTHSAAENIGGAFSLGLDKGRRPTQDSINSLVQTLSSMHPRAQKVAAETAIGMAATLEDKKELPAGSAKSIRDAVLRQFTDLNISSVSKTRKNVRDIAAAYESGARPVGQAALAIARSVDKVLEQLGVTTKAGKEAAMSVKVDSGNILAGARKAVGGYIGQAGERGRDRVNTWLGRGEVVLNWAQQKAADIAMAGRSSLQSIVSRTNAYHAGGPGDAMGLAQGGGPEFGGHPSNVHPAVARLITLLQRMFPLSVTSTTDHGRTRRGTISDHQTGGAVDLSGTPEVMNRAASWIKSSGLYKRLKQAIHNPNLAVNAGKLVDPSFYAGDWAGHVDHIHLAIVNAIGKLVGATSRRVSNFKLDDTWFGARRQIASAALNQVRRAGQRVLDGAESGAVTDEHGKFTKVHAKGNILANINLGQKMAQAMGWIGDQWRALRTLWQGESGWDDTAINPSSGAGGIPQSLPANKMGKGWQNNPSQQIAWGLRYIRDRYKSPLSALSAWQSRSPHWYSAGGPIPGQGPQEIVAHGGEHVWTASEVAKAGGHQVMQAMRKMLGGGGQGGPLSFLTGGAIAFDSGGIKRAAAETGSGSIYQTPAIFDTSLQGVLEEIGRAQASIRTLKTRGTKFFRDFGRSLSQITDDGGLFDQARSAIDRVLSSTATKLKRATFTIGTSGTVRQRLSQSDQDFAQLGVIDEQRRGLQSLRSTTASSLSDVNRRLAVLRRGGVSAKERKAYETLVAARRKLIAQIEDLDTAVADAIESRFQAQEKVLQDAIQSINDKAQRTLTRSDLADRLASVFESFSAPGLAFGLRGAALTARRQATVSQRDALLPILGQAQREGNITLVNDLVAQIEDLNVSLFENSAAISANTVAARQSTVDTINRSAQRALTSADLIDRVANLSEASGNSPQAFFLRRLAIQNRGSALGDQRSSLQGQLGAAQAGFDGSVAARQQIEDLTDQIRELDVSIEENKDALISNTTATRQSAIDRITSRGGFLGGVFGGLNNIVQTLGTITGQLDVSKLAELMTSAANILKQTGVGLRDQLLTGFGIDLHGATGQGLVDVLKNLNFDQIESSFTVEQKQQFEQLINAIIENEGALQQNTQQLQDLQATQNQSFSSSAWQIFRQAIFTGSGGLLPQFAIPAMASGGTVMSEGLIYAHPGEVMPARISRDLPASGGDTTNVYVTSPTEVLDPGYVGTVLSFRRALERAK